MHHLVRFPGYSNKKFLIRNRKSALTGWLISSGGLGIFGHSAVTGSETLAQPEVVAAQASNSAGNIGVRGPLGFGKCIL